MTPPRAEVAEATKGRLLEVAGRIAARDGAAGLTLDAVAREAGITKGGILYHFGSKDTLVAALLDRLCDAFQADVDAGLAAEGDGASAVGPSAAGVNPAVDNGPPGAFSRAFVRASFRSAEGDGPEAVGVYAGLLAAVGDDPALLDPIRARYAAWQARAEADGIDPAIATVARLAADGLVVAEILGLAPPTGELRARVLEVIEATTRGGSA